MSEFINTMDVVGDEILANSILDGSVTEYRDNRITAIGMNGLGYCPNLTDVNCPELEAIGEAGFRECSALTELDFPKLKSIGDYAFFASPALTTLVLRNESQCVTLGTRALEGGASTGTQIAYGTGYVYVPRALVDTYKAATNWSVYADQFRALEDYTVDGTTTGALDETKI